MSRLLTKCYYLSLILCFFFSKTAFSQCNTHLGPYFWGGTLNGLPADSIIPTGHRLADSLGGTVIRFTLACNTDLAYLIDTNCILNSNLSSLASRPDFNAILTDPQYKTVIITAYDWASFGDCNNQNFLDTAFYTPSNTAAIQQELTDFATYLGQFNNKTFIITNWEGDNSIYCGSAYSDPDCAAAPTAIIGFTKWVTARSAGIQAANQPNVKFGIEFCNIHSLENLGKPTVLDNVIPAVTADYYLYSSYESINISTAQTDSDITFIRNKLAGFGKDSNALIIGEMGFGKNDWGSAQNAATRLDSILKLVKQRNIPYGIVWTLMDTPYNFGSYDSVGELSPMGAVLKSNICDAYCAAVYVSESAVICEGQTYYVGNVGYSEAGNYFDTLQSSLGCDSIVNLQLSVIPTTYFFDTATICQGQSFSVGANGYTLPGNYADTVQSSSGCDSIINLLLNVIPIATSSISISICQGQTYYVGQIAHNLAGNYSDTIESTLGCDSIVNLQLSIIPSSYFFDTATICQGQSFSVGANSYTLAGNYADTIQSVLGCDSIINLLLNVIPITTSSINISICQGETYYVDQIAHNLAGNYSDTIESTLGCDSIVNLQLSIIPSSYFFDTATICQGQSFSVGQHIYTEAGTYFDTLQNVNGCDSAITLNLSIDSIAASIMQVSSDTLLAVGNGTIQWIDCSNMQDIAGATTAVFTSQIDGNYAAVFTNGTCSDTTTCMELIPVGIQNLKPVSVNIYPNPCSGLEYVVIAEAGFHSLRLFDSRGALILEQKLTDVASAVDISYLSDGIYLMEIGSDNWKVRKRIIRIE